MGLFDFAKRLKDELAKAADYVIPGDQSGWYGGSQQQSAGSRPMGGNQQAIQAISAGTGRAPGQPTALPSAPSSPAPYIPPVVKTAPPPTFKVAPPPTAALAAINQATGFNPPPPAQIKPSIPTFKVDPLPIVFAKELPGATAQVLTDVAHGIARTPETILRSVAQPGADALANLTGQDRFSTSSGAVQDPVRKFLYGDAPVETYFDQSKRFSDFLKNLGLDDTKADIAGVALAPALAGLDLFGGGKKEVVEQIAKEGGEQAIRQLLVKEFGEKAGGISDDVIKRLAKESDPAKVTTILRNAPPPKTPEIEGVKTYVAEQVKKQKEAARGERGWNKFVQEVRTKLVDRNAPLEDLVAAAQKGGIEIRPSQDPRFQIDRVLRADQPATQFVRDEGLEQVIRQAPNLDELNQYLIARHAPEWGEASLQTGRDAARDRALVEALQATYEPLAEQVSKYSRALLTKASTPLEEGGYGLISREVAEELMEKYPNYVPFDRIFSDDELAFDFVSGSGIANLERQSVVKKAKGSQREIRNPVESLLFKTTQTFKQGEKNRAAFMMAQLADRGAFGDVIKEVKPPIVPVANVTRGETVEETIFRPSKFGPREPHFTYLNNGETRFFTAPPEVLEVMKNLGPEEFGVLAKIAAFPTRALRFGATSANLPFALSNVVRDQVTAFINSDKALKTSVLNPLNFTQALWGAIGHGKEYEALMRAAAGGTSFDMYREAAPMTVAKIRSGRSIPSRIAYTVRHPSELLRAAEDIVGRSEDLARIQQFRGTREALGERTVDNTILAADAARNNTTNFLRKGEYMRTLNLLIPYLNAGVQGTRVGLRVAKERPLATGFKIAGVGLLPMAGITAWNLSDPDRKAAYDDIRQNYGYELEGNFVVIPNDPTQDEKGRWNVIKVPISQQIAALLQPVRRTMEAAADEETVDFGAIASDLLKTLTSIDTSGGRDNDLAGGLLNQLTPQALKPGVEGYTNTNLFTGEDIVPAELQDYEKSEQYRASTSLTAKRLGEAAGISPLQIENFIGTTLGGVGRQLVNLADRLQGSEDPGGQDIGDATTSRFTKARGTTEAGDYFRARDEAMKEAGLTQDEKEAYLSVIHPSSRNPQTGEKIDEESPFAQSSKAEVYLRYPKLFLLDKQLAQRDELHDPLFDLTPEQARNELLIRIYNKVAPGELGKDKQALRESLPADFQQQKDTYYAALSAKFGSTQNDSGPAFPERSAEVEALMSQYYALGTNTRAKANFKASHPQLEAQWSAEDAYYNSRRAAIGLPTLADVSPYPKKSSGSGGGRRRTTARVAGGSGRVKVPKIGSIKLAKPPKAPKIKSKIAKSVTTVKKTKIAKIKVPKMKGLA